LAQDYRDTLDSLSRDSSVGVLVSGMAGAAMMAAIAVWAVATDIPRFEPALSVSTTDSGIELRFGPDAPVGEVLLRIADLTDGQPATSLALADGSRLVRIGSDLAEAGGPHETWIILPDESPLEHLLRIAGLRR
jgi:hypothetical protein